MPLVSILVPSYNHALYLRACLDSVLAQDFADWELILIDDGSTDESLEIARSYVDPRVRVEANATNLGTYGALERALGMANGGLVAVLNSDDFWAPRKLREQVHALERHPGASIAYVLGWKADEASALDETEDVHADWPQAELQEPLPNLLCENRILASGVLFRREALRFDSTLRYSGDWSALLGASLRGPAACVPERLTFWRQHGANTYLQSPAQMLEEIRVRLAIDARKAWSVRSIDGREIRDGLGRNAMNLVALHAFFGDSGGVRRFGLRAMRLCRNKRRAVKRALSSLVSARRRRLHFWPDAEASLPWGETPAWRERLLGLQGLEFGGP